MARAAHNDIPDSGRVPVFASNRSGSAVCPLPSRPPLMTIGGVITAMFMAPKGKRLPPKRVYVSYMVVNARQGKVMDDMVACHVHFGALLGRVIHHRVTGNTERSRQPGVLL